MLLSTLGGASGLRVIAVTCVGGRSRQLKLAFTGAKPHNSVSSKSRYSHRAIQKKQPLSKTFAAQGKNDKQLLTDDSQMPQTLPKVALVVLLLAVASTAFYVFGVQHISIKDIAASLDELVRSYGPLGPVIFVAAYVVATLVLIPSTALTLAAGYLFGPGFGTALVSLAATLGASLAFLISRYLAQPYAKAKLKAYPRLESIEEQISAEGLKPVLLQHQRLQRVSRQPGMATQAATSTIKAPADGNFYKYGLKPVLGEGIMEATLKRLGAVEIKDMDKSNFVKPKSVMYDLDGKRRRWDMISSHSSVGVIIYHTELDALIVVRQFRPPAYASAMMLAEEAGEPAPPLSVGFTYELCAGIIDKKKSLAQIAAEEVKEECGFKVAPEKLQWVTQYVSAVGTGGSRHDMYYAEVDESMRVGKGGGLENTGERIEVLALPLDESKGFTEDHSYPKSAGLLFGLMWLRAYIAAKKQLPAKHVV